MNNPFSLPDCPCAVWATDQMTALLLGNGHHPRCDKFVPDVRATYLIRDLVEGIEEWGAQEDGVPDWLWDAYARAVFVVRGKMPEPKGVQS